MLADDIRGNRFYWFCRWLVVVFFRSAYRWKTIGAERVPKTGGVVLASNHIHNLDPFLVGAGVPRYIQFMAKEELFKFQIIAKIVKNLGAFPVKRGIGDKRAIKRSVEVTNHGGCLMIFPEGHRSKTGQLQAGQPGVAFIARKSNCPIIPVAVIGKYRLWSRLTVRYGTPFTPDANDTNESLLEKIMVQIQILLDEGPTSP